MSDPTILFYRFGFASIILAIVMLIRRISFKVTRGELVTLIYLAFISDGSALFLIDGYNYMSSGVATTLHFMYPVVTAIIMMTFYNEARRLSTILAVCMAVGGVGILSWDPTGNTSVRGVIIVLVSAVCYALYLIGALIFGAEALRQGNFSPITTDLQWSNLASLAIICTFITNVSLVYSVKRIGSTMTAVLGALEPLTAVIIGCLIFNEAFNWQVMLGINRYLPGFQLVLIYNPLEVQLLFFLNRKHLIQIGCSKSRKILRDIFWILNTLFR